MVLESFVANLLNKYLGDYVENLDKSQLKIGIWGGNVSLKNLDLKASALDELYLPVRVVSGHLGTLVIKIPWSKPYQEPWEVVIDGLLLIAVPNAEIQYDAAREEKAEQERKQKKLNKIEDFKSAETEKAKQQQASGKDDTFAEKLAAHVVKNLEVTIANVHVRYEDAHTIPGQQLAVGVSLENLSFRTVNENGVAEVIKESVSKIFKSVRLSNLALYFDCYTCSCLSNDKAEVKLRMQQGITTKTNKASHQFVVKPINLTVDLALDTKPALSGYQMPKALLELVLEEIGLVLTRRQYLAVVELLQSFERMVLGDKYRKYRQTLPAKPSIRDWWQYAYLCTVEEEVRRRRRAWSWDHMRHHRNTMRLYKAAYRQMVESKKPSTDVLRSVEQYEKQLDVFSITVVRQQAELEVERKQREKASSGGFFSFFSRGKKQDSEKKEGFEEQEILSQEERQKLYAAIGYDESGADPSLPKNYVAYLMHFNLRRLSLSLMNDDMVDNDGQAVSTKDVLAVDASGVTLDFLQRPAAESMCLTVLMEAFTVLGMAVEQGSGGSWQSVQRATLARQQLQAAEALAAAAASGARVPLLFVKYEEKPEDGACERRVVLKAQPLEIVYDAETINKTVAIFKPPENIQLKSLSKAAVSRYRKFKHQSSIGLQHIVEHHKYTEIKIDIPASYIIVPENGQYKENESHVLVMDLGHFKMNSEKDPNATKRYRAKAMMRKAREQVAAALDGSFTDEFAEDMRKKAYDSFAIDLQRVQILYARAGTDWRVARRQQVSPCHVLRPMGFSILLQRCMIEDVSLPSIRIMGKLPQLSVSLSDMRLIELLSLALSIPLPALDRQMAATADDDNTDAISLTSESEETMLQALESPPQKAALQANNMTFVDVSFEIEEVEINLTRRQTKAGGTAVSADDEQYLRLRLSSLGTHMSVRSFDLVIDTYLCGVYLQHLAFKALGTGAVLGLVNTPVDDDTVTKLLTVTYIKANRDNPEFATTYAATEQKLLARFAALELLLHREALMNIAQTAVLIADNMSSLTAAKSRTAAAAALPHQQPAVAAGAATAGSRSTSVPARATAGPRKSVSNVVTFHLEANLHTFEITLCTRDLVVLNAKIKGLDVGIIAKLKQTDVRAQLKDIVMYDPTPHTAFPKIVEIHEGSELLNLHLITYVDATAGAAAYADMNRVDTRLELSVSSVRVTYLNRWLTNIVNFASAFESAKQKVMEAGARVGEMAAEAAANAYARAPRVAISATVNAPVVLVPRGSTAREAILLNFGTLAIENSFAIIDRRATSLADNHVPVADRMKIRVQGVQAARVLLKERDQSNESLTVLSTVLNPINLGLTVSRNLSFAWFTGKPEVDVDATLPKIALSLSQEDFTSIIATILDNLQEPPDLVAVVVDGSTLAVSRADIHLDQSVAASSARMQRYSRSSEIQTTPKVDGTSASTSGGTTGDMIAVSATTRIRCSFKLDSVDVRLYAACRAVAQAGSIMSAVTSGSSGSSSSYGSSSSSSQERDESLALAHFQLLDTAFNLGMQADGSLQACVAINDCILDDVRPSSRNGITRMIERVVQGGEEGRREAGHDAAAANSSMVSVTYTQDVESGSAVDITVNKILIMVCLEYLMTVSKFFIEGMPKMEAQQAAQIKEKQDEMTLEKRNRLQNVLIIKANIQNPDIVLVEDARCCDTNALVVDTGGAFKMSILPDAYSLMVDVSLQIISAKYSCRSRSYKKQAQILAPCTVAASGTAPEGKGLHLGLSVSDITLNIAPATISTISRIASNLMASQAETSAGPAVAANGTIWLTRKIEECDLWYVKGVAGSSVDGDVGNADGSRCSVAAPRKEQLLLEETKVVVMLEGGVGYRTVPLLLAELKVQSEVKDWSQKLSVSTELSVEVAYYNEWNAVWEPFVEPVEDMSERRGVTRPWQLSVQVQKNEEETADVIDGYDSSDEGSTASADVINVQPPRMSITVWSGDMLQICLTKASLDMLTKLGQSFTEAYRLVEPSARPGEVLAPYSIRNDTGVTVLVTLDRELKPTSDAKAAAATAVLVAAPDTVAGERLTLDAGMLLAAEPKRRALPRSESVLRRMQTGEERCFIFEVPEYSADSCTTIVQKAEMRSFILSASGRGAPVEFVVQTEVELGRVLVVLRSPVQVRNALEMAIEIWHAVSTPAGKRRPGDISVDGGDTSIRWLATVECDQTFNIPLPALYSSDGGKLYVKPAGRGFTLPLAAICWQDFRVQPSSLAASDYPGISKVVSSFIDEERATTAIHPATGQSASFDFVVYGQMQKAFKEGNGSTMQPTTALLALIVRPCLTVDNQLPYLITVESSSAPAASATASRTLEPCATMQMYSEHPDTCKVKVTLHGYLGADWVYEGAILASDAPSAKVTGTSTRHYRWTLACSTAADKRSVNINALVSTENGTVTVVLFSPYWMVNRTATQLSYRDSPGKELIHVHPLDHRAPYLFSYNKLMSSKSDKVKLKIGDSHWSNSFSLDTVGSTGIVSCRTSESKHRARAADLQAGVKITLASNGLTKIVEFSPYYILINDSKKPLKCIEQVLDGSGMETLVSPGQYVGFYPQESHKLMAMRVLVMDSDGGAAQPVLSSLPFAINEPHSTLLRLERVSDAADEGSRMPSALYAECTTSEWATTIQFEDFAPGNEAVRLVNHTAELNVEYGQVNSSGKAMVKTVCLLPGCTVLYTWDDPLQPRVLQWTCGKETAKNSLLADGVGEFFVTEDAKVFWVSFLDGLQRVLLFTEDIFLARQAQEAGELERLDQELTVSLHGVGLSLVNNTARQEVAYLGMTSSGIVWEEKKKTRWRALGAQRCETLEKAFQNFEQVRAVMASSSTGQGVTSGGLVDIGGGRVVDLERMVMVNSRDGGQPRSVRRLFQPGVWCAYKTSAHQLQLHTKINRLQLDNPLTDAVYTVVLAPTPLPKSLTGDNLPKPFFEGSVLVRKHEHSGVLQVRYLKVLVQEMQLQGDQGFINSLIIFFGAEHRDRGAIERQFREDVQRSMTSLSESMSAGHAHGDGKTFYDLLHISPLKVHLSFSIHGSKSSPTAGAAAMIRSDVINLFLQSVGMVLTDVQDVVFRLGYFERNFMFYDKRKLLSAIQLHYTQQAIKQAYVLVLGLDVLGNPFAFVQGLAEGAKDLFYEPAQGLIQGPEEFAEGLALGLRSVFGHTVGGAAGAVSRITGTLGKGLAVLTLDDEYQRRRREKMNRQPANLQEGLARGVKGLGMGFFDGVTGIVRKPVEGAKQEGVEGFFKGLGKGLIGVVARPTGGIVDFASSSLEGVRRAAAVTSEVQRLRPPRFLNTDGIVRPYNSREALGNAILEEIRNKSHAKSDNYVAHVFVTNDGVNALLATDRQVLFIRRGELLGHWDVEWQYSWAELREAPFISQDGKTPAAIMFYTKDDKKKTFNPFAFGSTDKGKRVMVEDHESAEFLVKEMKEAYRKHK